MSHKKKSYYQTLLEKNPEIMEDHSVKPTARECRKSKGAMYDYKGVIASADGTRRSVLKNPHWPKAI